MTSDPGQTCSYCISAACQGMRLDVYLTEQHPGQLSRSKIQDLIRRGEVTVNQTFSKPGYRLQDGDRVDLTIPPPMCEEVRPQDVPFSILYEDEGILVLSKPAGVVVHPAPGHAEGTLAHGLLKHCEKLSQAGGVLRPGIVHRLDKDTSGLMVAAKRDDCHIALAHQFKTGRVTKEYVAFVHGWFSEDRGSIDLPIARHPSQRQRMAVVPSGGRHALSLWTRLESFETNFTFLAITIKTGRTHQIRVHLSHAGHPVVGDRVYGYGARWWRPFEKKHNLFQPGRQMLHARRLGFQHPESGLPMIFEEPMPSDMRQFLASLRENVKGPDPHAFLTPEAWQDIQ